MTAYCKCKICKASPAQPKAGMQGNDRAEEVAGRLITLNDNDVLVHWTDRVFTRQLSVELRDIKKRGVNPVAVACSYMLYRNTATPPVALPQVLKQLGLGGKNRYFIRKAATQGMSIYLRAEKESTNGNPSEVAVVIGCGGSIVFDATKNATTIESAEVAGGKANAPRSRFKFW